MSLKFFSQLIYSLHDTEHVVRFQKFFNLQILVENNGGNQAEHSSNKQQQNKTTTLIGKSEKPKRKYLITNDNKKYCINNFFWYYLFSFGANLGYELFYALFYSYSYWNLDSLMCRQLMLIWASLLYVGQLLKDIIRWPRPSGPEVLVLEPDYSVEYGMPSTHAMLAMMVPITLYHILNKRYELSVPIFLVCGISWCALICCSRIYLGMHSILDILAGLLLASGLLVIILPWLDLIDYCLIRYRLAPLFLYLTLIALALIYPKNNNNSPSRGDTCTIISGFGGVYLGSWLNYHLGIIHPYRKPNVNQKFLINWPSIDEIPILMARVALGLILIALFRFAAKTLALMLVKRFVVHHHHHHHQQDDGDDGKTKNHKTKQQNIQHLTVVEVPVKLITYTAVGLTISFIGPSTFSVFGLDRKTMYFEA